MKNIIYFVAFISMAASTFTSCNKSDKDEDNNLIVAITDTTKFDYGTDNLKRLVSVKNQSSLSVNYNYDDFGRATTCSLKDEGYSMTYNCNYKGHTGSINQKYVEIEGEYAISYGFDGIATLNDNGLLSQISLSKAAASKKIEYSYNKEGYITGMTTDESEKYQNKVSFLGKSTSYFTWTDGNLAVCEDNETWSDFAEGSTGEKTSKYTFSYTNSKVSAPIANVARLNIYDVDFNNLLETFGFQYLVTGNHSKNLPVTIKEEDSDGSDNTYDLEWVLDADGYPTKLSVNDSYGNSTILNFTWE